MFKSLKKCKANNILKTLSDRTKKNVSLDRNKKYNNHFNKNDGNGKEWKEKHYSKTILNAVALCPGINCKHTFPLLKRPLTALNGTFSFDLRRVCDRIKKAEPNLVNAFLSGWKPFTLLKRSQKN